MSSTVELQEQLRVTDSDLDRTNLLPSEQYWRDQYEWLLRAGYQLRSRYRPGWVASWVGTNTRPEKCEDYERPFYGTINHAIRLEGGGFVVLKRIDKVKHPREIEVMKYLSEEMLASDPRNHSIRPIDILQHPTDDNTSILVIPLLRDYDRPPFHTMGEALDFILQFLTAIHFLHENRVAHGDVSINNIMMDASGMYPDGFHPCRPSLKRDHSAPLQDKFTRTEKPPKYYLIDFGLSKRYKDGEPLIPDRVGTDLTVPEFIDDTKPVNPFFVDVYCVGNMIRSEFLDGDTERANRPGYYNFEFLRPLIADMTNDDPLKRPTMDAVVAQFDDIIQGISSSTLRSPALVKGRDLHVSRAIQHWYKRITYIIRRLPAIPSR